MKHLYLLTMSLIFSLGLSAQNLTIQQVIPPIAPIYDCSTSTVTINTYLGCINAVHAGNNVSVVGSTVTINVTYTLGPICFGAISYPVHNVQISNLPAGPVSLVVTAILDNVPTNTITTPITVIPCCPSTADAGADTSMCDQNQVTLGANTAPSFSTASWSVLSGGATLSSPTNPNAIASNLSYGVNEFVWTMVDSVCTTTDTMVVVNSQVPTAPQTEMDRFSCYDTTSIFANVLTIGSATWAAHTPGVSVANIKQPKARVLGLQSGTNVFSYTSENGACVLADTLKIDHSSITVQPAISVSGLQLTSSPAPAYQWYLDNAKISGATGQSHTAVANGEYTVMATEIGCDNGMLSDPVEVKTVGINDLSSAALTISPNPSRGVLTIDNLASGTLVTVLNVFGKEISNEIAKSTRLTMNISTNVDGIYFVRMNYNQNVVTKKILLKK